MNHEVAALLSRRCPPPPRGALSINANNKHRCRGPSQKESEGSQASGCARLHGWGWAFWGNQPDDGGNKAGAWCAYPVSCRMLHRHVLLCSQHMPYNMLSGASIRLIGQAARLVVLDCYFGSGLLCTWRNLRFQGHEAWGANNKLSKRLGLLLLGSDVQRPTPRLLPSHGTVAMAPPTWPPNPSIWFTILACACTS